MHHVRKMRMTEFKTIEDHLRKDAAGNPCHYAVEGDMGTVARGLSQQQASAKAEMLNVEPVAA